MSESRLSSTQSRPLFRMVSAPEPAFARMVGWDFELLKNGKVKWTGENGATITLTLRPLDLGRHFEEVV